MMPELTPPITPPASDYGTIGEQARNLSRTLQFAPAQESHSAAALRRYLMGVSASLAHFCEAQSDSLETDMNYSEEQQTCRTLLSDMRQVATELCAIPNIVPPGIQGLLEAYAEKFLPGTLLALRPNGNFGYSVKQPLKNLETQLSHLKLSAPPTNSSMPKHFLIMKYPQGEQDNVLQACNLLRYFHDKRRLIVVASTLGPAYFFAFANEVRTSYPFNTAYDLPYLCFVFELLQNQGWLDHPHIGPLLNQWQDHFGFNVNYLQNFSMKVLDKSLLEEMEEAKEQAKGLHNGFTPEIFDRDVPVLWERLRNLMPPNDLHMNAVESSHPADVMSIMNAGWSFQLLHMGELHRILACRTHEDRYEAKQVLNRLLTKGIELSRIATHWQSANEVA